MKETIIEMLMMAALAVIVSKSLMALFGLNGLAAFIWTYLICLIVF